MVMENLKKFIDMTNGKLLEQGTLRVQTFGKVVGMCVIHSSLLA